MRNKDVILAQAVMHFIAPINEIFIYESAVRLNCILLAHIFLALKNRY